MKAKKVLAMLMASAMIMGTTVTAFAAVTDAAEIDIENAGADAKFNYVQIVTANSQTKTGWDIADEYYDDFHSAFETVTGTSQVEIEQRILEAMIYEATDGNAGTVLSTFDKDYAEAINAIHNDISMTDDVTKETPLEVNSAGVYVIKGSEAKYSYSPMTAYVGFGYTDGTATTLGDTTVEAKKAPTDHEKSDTDADKVTEIGKKVTYNITGTVPYILETDSNRQYWVTDAISGAEYITTDDQEGNKIVTVTVIIGNVDTPAYKNEFTAVVTEGAEGDKYDGRDHFTLNLTSLLGTGTTANQYANDPITISYSAEVTGVEVNNDSWIGKGEHDGSFGTDSDKLYTAQIQVIKVAYESEEDSNLVDNDKLAGAEFILYKGEGNNKEYAVVQNGVFVDWTHQESGASKMTTNAQGNIAVNGLDVGIYYFQETKAPEGYSLDATPVRINVTQDGVAESAPLVTQYKTNTTLSSLPSTGGIGTTIFTIGGCAIMVTAAGLYFATRKKEQN